MHARRAKNEDQHARRRWEAQIVVVKERIELKGRFVRDESPGQLDANYTALHVLIAETLAAVADTSDFEQMVALMSRRRGERKNLGGLRSL